MTDLFKTNDFMAALKELEADPEFQAPSTFDTPIEIDTRKVKTKSKWTNKHYPLFKLPLVEVYLKGFNPNLPDQPSLEEALAACIVSSLGPALKYSALRLNLVEDLKAFKTSLYTNQTEIKNWHIGLVDSCVREGLAVELDQCISKDRALARLENYWNDRAEELAKLGFSSIEDYRASLDQKKTSKSLDPINPNDLDW